MFDACCPAQTYFCARGLQRPCGHDHEVSRTLGAQGGNAQDAEMEKTQVWQRFCCMWTLIKTQIHEVVDAQHKKKKSCNLNGFEVLAHKVTENVENGRKSHQTVKYQLRLWQQYKNGKNLKQPLWLLTSNRAGMQYSWLWACTVCARVCQTNEH